MQLFSWMATLKIKLLSQRWRRFFKGGLWPREYSSGSNLISMLFQLTPDRMKGETLQHVRNDFDSNIKFYCARKFKLCTIKDNKNMCTCVSYFMLRDFESKHVFMSDLFYLWTFFKPKYKKKLHWIFQLGRRWHMFHTPRSWNYIER